MYAISPQISPARLRTESYPCLALPLPHHRISQPLPSSSLTGEIPSLPTSFLFFFRCFDTTSLTRFESRQRPSITYILRTFSFIRMLSCVKSYSYISGEH